MWVYLGIVSAAFLGMYDVSRKHALRQNAVLPVLFLSTVFGALVVLPLVLLSRAEPAHMSAIAFYVPPLAWVGHFHVLAKSVIVSVAWTLSYLALKNLPISIVSPVSAIGPVWTLLGAVILFHEQPTVLQYLGFGVMVLSYWWFSVIGSKEGILFYNNRWIAFTVLATMLGAASAMYDKFLIQRLDYPPMAVQAWFSIYVVPVLGVFVLLFWWPGRKRYTPFIWRWSIVTIGLMLLAADFLYFKALSYQGSLIAMLSTLRCAYIVISLFAGGLLFKESRLSSKTTAVAGILFGVFLILLSK
ncbi:MAG TPA: DMT family transporter [Sedimentisphaerales bacterium]|nr:DMT family transporter [Sedimentisphaerales bacterium]